MYEVLIALVAIANILVVDNVISVNLRHQILIDRSFIKMLN